MMIKDTYALHKHSLMNISKAENCETIENFINVLDAAYIVKARFTAKPNRTLLNRINACWIVPLFVISIPFQYIIRGDNHIDERSKIGRIIQWFIGELI